MRLMILNAVLRWKVITESPTTSGSISRTSRSKLLSQPGRPPVYNELPATRDSTSGQNNFEPTCSATAAGNPRTRQDGQHSHAGFPKAECCAGQKHSGDGATCRARYCALIE